MSVLFGGSITEALPGVGVQGGKSIHHRVGNRRTKGPINFEWNGNIGEQGRYGEQGNRYHLPSLGGPHQ